MSNEISISLSYNVANPSTGTGYTSAIRENVQYNQNLQAANEEVVSVGTTATTFAFSNLTTYGYAYFQNLDPTNYVQLGLSVSAVFTPFARLKPGEIALFRLEPGVTFQMKANTAACVVWYKVIND